MNNVTIKKRSFSMDLLRVIACYLVINQHASEFYYIGNNGTTIPGDNSFWIGIMTSFGRISVPLFVMISGFFLIPMKDTTSQFFKKRLMRVVYPFIFWCIGYAVFFFFYNGETIHMMFSHIIHIPINYGTEVGHLWYIYMIIGLYLLIPILTPWLRNCSKKELQGFLWLWAFTTLIPYIHRLFPEVLGECYWNESPMLYYFSGFVGYLILGYYIKAYGALSIKKSIALIIIGYAITSYLFCSRINTAVNIADLELSWQFCTLNILMITYGFFSLIKSITYNGSNAISRLVTDISVNSYGMYLAHIMLLNLYHDLFKGMFSTVLIEVPLITLCTFVTVYLVIKLMSYLPKSKYWLG